MKSCVSETCDTIYIDAGQARPPDGAFASVTAGAYHTCGLKVDGSVDCWGANINTDQRSIGQAQDRAGPFTQVSAGMWHNCAVRKAAGLVECWGDTANGKATPPAGANHTCGLKPDGSVACWGGNTWGQAPKTRTGPYKELQAGDLFTCGLKPDGILDCWGYNFYGQTKEPQGVLTTFGLGDAHGCATLDSNDEWICWGRNDHGQAPDNPALPPEASDPEDQPPVVQIFLAPAEPDGANGWRRSPVTVEPQARDDTEVADLRCALDPASPPAAFDDLPQEICPFLGGAQVRTDGEHTFYAAAVEVWGNKSEVVSSSFQIDATSPVLTCPEAGPFLLGSGEHTVGPAGVDATVSGLDEAASTLTGVVSTESVGPQTLTFTAVDLAGNTASQECTDNVIFDFGGFYPPVEPAPALNDARAGQTIPLKFSLTGDQGLEVIAAGYPASQAVDCETLEPIGSLEATEPPGRSGLSYAAGNGRYSYEWKTRKEWAGTCRVLALKLADKTDHLAAFRFR